MWRVLLAASFVGCSHVDRCATFAELEVTDPHHVGSDGILASVRAAVDEFAAWTGRDGVCVSEVRLTGAFGLSLDLDGHAHGRSSSAGLVEIDPRWPIATSVRHELCHALDEAEDLSSRHVALFPDRDPAEGLAESCEAGPDGAWLELALGACDDGVDPGAALVFDEVWTEWEPEFEWAPMPTARREVAGVPDDNFNRGGPVGGPDGIWLTRFAPGPGGVGQLSFLRVDPERGAVVATVSGPPLSDEGRWLLLGGDEDPLLLVTDGEVAAFRLRDDALVPAAFPPEVTGVWDGALAAGAAWVQGGFEGEGSLLRVDLATSAVTRVSAPPVPGTTRALTAGGGRLAGTWADLEGHVTLAILDPADESWTTAEWPPSLRPSGAVPLTDGRVLVRWIAHGGAIVGGFGVYDPAADAWSADEDACGDGRTNVLASLLMIGERPWSFEFADPQGLAGHDTVAVIELSLR